MRFKVMGWCVSGFNINANNISIFPKPSSTKVVTVDRSVVSGEYTVWNSWGSVRYAKDPELSTPLSDSDDSSSHDSNSSEEQSEEDNSSGSES